jgi:hypothetical protein
VIVVFAMVNDMYLVPQENVSVCITYGEQLFYLDHSITYKSDYIAKLIKLSPKITGPLCNKGKMVYALDDEKSDITFVVVPVTNTIDKSLLQETLLWLYQRPSKKLQQALYMNFNFADKRGNSKFEPFLTKFMHCCYFLSISQESLGLLWLQLEKNFQVIEQIVQTRFKRRDIIFLLEFADKLFLPPKIANVISRILVWYSRKNKHYSLCLIEDETKKVTIYLHQISPVIKSLATSENNQIVERIRSYRNVLLFNSFITRKEFMFIEVGRPSKEEEEFYVLSQ